MESTLTLYVPYRSYKKIFSTISVIELLKEKGEKRRREKREKEKNCEDKAAEGRQL